MAPETSWGKDTVRLGAADSAAHEADVVGSGKAPEPAKDTGPREDANWGTETVVLAGSRAGRAGGSARVSRREPARHRALVAAVAVTVVAIAALSLIGGGGDRKPQLVAPTHVRGAANRTLEREMRAREERRMRAERKARAAHIARERRRLRERRHRQREAARESVRAEGEPAPVADQALEVEPEYAPEPSPAETAPAPEAAPPSPTPPGVEFGM
jgi:hypothetical protein